MKNRSIVSNGDFVTMNDISHRLRLTPATVAAWRKGNHNRRLLPVRTVRHGLAHRVLVAEGDLLAWLAAYRPDLHRTWIGEV